MTAVKICGLSTQAGVDAVLNGGAEFIGFVVFEPSPRHVAPAAAAQLARAALGRAKVVAVTVDADDALVADIMQTLRPDLIQLHGRETPARAEHLRQTWGVGIIRALALSHEADLALADDWEPFADHLLFDARPPAGADRPGGYGLAFDWTMLADRAFRQPWFLAGGLNPDNVAQAIQISGAPMVDVSSGVESAPGVKDAALIAAFLERCKRA